MKRLLSYLSASLVVLFAVLGAVPASAANNGSSGLSITPRKNYVINPGQTINDKLTIGNLSSSDDLTVSLRMIDFTFTNQSGTPKLFLADNAPQTAWSLKPFTTLPKTVTVPAHQTKTIQYSITVPKNTGAGSYYSAILYQAGAATSGQVALNASGVTLVFVSVPGVVKENMTVQKFGAYNSVDNGVTGSFVFIATQNAPQMIAYALKNNGNVAESPAGSITLKDMFGHQISSINKTNINSSLALLGQTRLFTTCIKTVQEKIKLEGGTSTNTSCTNPGLWPGRYTATLDIFYGQNGNQTHEVTATASFWYLPWWFIIAVIIILLLIVWAVWWLKRKIRGALNGSNKQVGTRRR
jgi:hypothetical protein